MKIKLFVFEDSFGEPELYETAEEAKEIIYDWIKYELTYCSAFEEQKKLFVQLEDEYTSYKEGKSKKFGISFYEREMTVYEKEIDIACGW